MFWQLCPNTGHASVGLSKVATASLLECRLELTGDRRVVEGVPHLGHGEKAVMPSHHCTDERVLAGLMDRPDTVSPSQCSHAEIVHGHGFPYCFLTASRRHGHVHVGTGAVAIGDDGGTKTEERHAGHSYVPNDFFAYIRPDGRRYMYI